MDKKDIEQLLQRYRNGEQLSATEKRWLDSFYVYHAKQSANHIDDQEMQDNLAKVESKIKHSISAARSIKRIYRLSLAAASIVAILSLGYYFAIGPFSREHELHLANGQLKQIVLEDGTKITLNASSKLIYPKSFKDAKRREVTLIGEAYFDVAKNAQKPFLIHTPRMEIRVLGTAFNVRDYEGEKNAETSLIHGKVEIWKAGKQAEKFVLKPKEKFVLQESQSPPQNIDRKSALARTENMSVKIQPFTVSEENGSSVETEWMSNRITIKDESLAQIAQRLERMYGVKIDISDKSVADQVYSATFDNERIEDVLKGLQTVAPFRYSMRGNNNIEVYK